MTNKEIYKLWCFNNASWTEYTKPIAFINITNTYTINNFNIPKIEYINDDTFNTIIIVDLKDYDSLKEAVALTKYNFIPIPLFNGVLSQDNAISNVDNEIVSAGILAATNYIKDIKFKNKPNPAFLLNSNRLNRFRLNETIFDSSYDMYRQDFPTYNKLLENNINKVIVRSDKINSDLKKILYPYSKNGIEIFLVTDNNILNKVKINKPKEIII